jgi:phosphoglycerate dehydrogenase-like enzyme
MTETVLVSELEYAKGRDVFQAAAELRVQPAPVDELELAAAVLAAGARAVIVGVMPYLGPLYEALAEVAAGRGALIARFGVGHDSIDKRQAAARGITVTNTPGVLDQSVAEHTVWLMGCLAKNVARGDASLHAGQFQGMAGIELGGRTLGLVGCGPIGRRVARIAHHGLGMCVLAAGRRSAAEIGDVDGVDRYTNEVDQVFREADVVSLHVPATAETRHFVDRRRLGLMRPSALLVNTARGVLVDERALFDALAGDVIGGAALDVFETEPYVPVAPDKDLRQLSNVVLTPHIGSNTREANRRMAEASLHCALEFLAGRADGLPRVN